MSKTDIAKTVAKTVVGTSVSFTVARVLAANTPTSTNLQNAERFVGAFVCGWMVADYAETWTDAKIDSTVDWWNSTFKKNA